MEIKDIKAQLTLAQVLDYYGLKPDKHLRLHCPFHHDRTPSLQVYYKTQSCYCFSTNCPTHGKSLDVIDFILHKENCSKHEAIKKAESMIVGTNPDVPSGRSGRPREFSRADLLGRMFTYFKNGLHNSKPAQDYCLQQRQLDFKKLEIGYNSGQFHHGKRKDEVLINSCIQHGLLLDRGHVNNRTGEKAYSPFGKSCIVFPLRNPHNQITGLYFRSTINNTDQRHFYLKDRQGLYPSYPKQETKKLLLTESIIDCATLQQLDIKGYEWLALYGTNGLTDEHKQAIQDLPELEEIIFFLNGDEPGRKATVKHGADLHQLLLPKGSGQAGIQLSTVEVPENEDVNSLAQSHNFKIFTHLIENRLPVRSETRVGNPISFVPSVQAGSHETLSVESETDRPGPEPKPATGKLNAKNPHHIIYQGQTAHYIIKGLSKGQLDSLKITLFIEDPKTKRKSRSKVDLYEDKQVERTAREAAEKLALRSDLIILDIEHLTDLLDQHREASHQEGKKEKVKAAPIPDQARDCIRFLSKPNLISRFNALIGKAGVIGEENNRIFLFGIAASYKMPVTLHALIQGSSGSGKTHLLTAISQFIPEEDKKHFTRVTEGSLYNYGRYDLSNKLICLEDLDGMKEEAYLAFRELQSRGMISSSTSGKDEAGNIRAFEKVVYGPIASMSCTTQGEIYEDNMNRCFLLAVDESREQTERVIRYQNQKASGQVDKAKEQQVTGFVQNCIRLLKPYAVVNPYAGQVQLPKEAHKIRRLNELYQSYVKQITLLHQYRRSKDHQGRLVSEKEDLQVAAEIMFDSILLKIDELDGSLRLFYERLKDYIKSKGENHQSYSFGQREIRQALHVSKTQLHRYIHDLMELEYLQQSGGYANRGYQYTISYWDNVEQLRGKVKRHLQGQLDQLEMLAFHRHGTPDGTPAKAKNLKYGS